MNPATMVLTNFFMLAAFLAWCPSDRTGLTGRDALRPRAAVAVDTRATKFCGLLYRESLGIC